MKRHIKILIAALALMVATSSCIKDLDVQPLDPKLMTSDKVFSTPAAYLQALAKIYASYAVSGQQGPAGNPDISGIDEGFGNYLRQYWNAQELSTDEAVISWNDATIKDFHWHTWAPNDVFIAALYSRIFFTIAISNEFIRVSEGKTEGDIPRYQAEARFIRALSYWHAIDLFGSTPFVTEKDKPGAFFPEQIKRDALFSYIEAELKDIETKLGPPRFSYGRADQAAAWMLLAKLYMNAQVYIGQPKYTEALVYINKVIGAGYTLAPDYQNNFVADNHTSPEMIFAINFDGEFTRTYGGMVYLIHAAIGGSMPPAQFGVGGGWGGLRTTSAFVRKFYPNAANGFTPPTTMMSFVPEVQFPVIYVPGGYQQASGYGNNWDPSNTTTVLASVNSDNNYEGYIYFADAGSQFKFTAGPNWDTNWGDDGANGTLEPNGANIVAAVAGYYKINVNLNNMTFTMVRTHWGVIGDATANGWNSDQDLTFNPTTKLWTARLELTGGNKFIKFRANDGWDINYGDDGLNGTLEAGGANIPIAQTGTYQITLKLNKPLYTYTIERLSWDKRAMFWTDGQSLEIVDIGQFTEGWAITKFKNVNKNGSAAIRPHPDFVCTDYPMFRLADAYLMYAECVLRGGTGGTAGQALTYMNALRTRAYGDAGGNITSGQLNLNYILDERARELYWEGHRRTDLVRFGQFTSGTYQWPWKGKVAAGKATEAFRDLYPIPSADLGANPKLKQNPGY